MRKTAIALIGAMAFAFGGAAVPTDAYAKDKPKTAKVQVKKAAKPTKVKVVSKCKPGEKWNATATLSAGACEKRKVAKIKVKSAPKAAEKPVEKPAVIKKTG